LTARKGAWGGPRRGAGRRPGPTDTVRRNRVTITLTDAELAKLHRLAEKKDLPLGTAAYEIVARVLARQR
jgi:hypothetical protein